MYMHYHLSEEGDYVLACICRQTGNTHKASYLFVKAGTRGTGIEGYFHALGRILKNIFQNENDS